MVGAASLQTMSRFYTGYGESPSQGKIRNQGVAYTLREYPKLDIVEACTVVREGLPWQWQQSS